MSRPDVQIVEGDLLDQPVEVIVNAWNRNVFPAWILVPHGVAGAIRKRAGYAPFREVRKHGVLPVGAAVETSAGRLPYRAIIHVAGLHLAWHSSERAVRLSVRNAIELARSRGYRSVALPLIGAGTLGVDVSYRHMLDELRHVEYGGEVVVVRRRTSEDVQSATG